MSLQDMRAGSAVNACKTCEHAATVRLQYNINTVGHSSGPTIVLADPIALSHAADRGWRGRTTRPDVPTSLKTSFTTSNC
jgi:hypothetical protein